MLVTLLPPNFFTQNVLGSFLAQRAALRVP